MNKQADQACIECHFLMKQSNPYKFAVNPQERESIRRGDYSAFKNASIGCYFGVWDEGYNFEEQRRHETIVETDRKHFCFFWKYRDGMLFPAAKILQKRQADNQEASRDRRLTIWALWIAGAGLLFNAMPEVVKMVGSIGSILAKMHAGSIE